MDTLIALIWYLSSLLIMIVLGSIFFDEDKKISKRNAIYGLINSRGYLFILLIIFIFIKIENILQDHFIMPDFTHLFYELEGNGIIVFLQEHLQNPFFIHSVCIFYLLFFFYVMIFTIIFFVLRGESQMVKTCVYAILINYIVLIPFYLFFNVKVTCDYPDATPVKPLLYSNSQYMALVLLADRLTDNFPSGHVSVLVSISLILLLKTNLKRYTIFTILVTALTPFAIIYLGIHWISDIFAGILLGIIAYFGANSKRITKWFDGFTKFIEEKLIKINYSTKR
ncbi:hypothetical protein B6U81_03525 [Thermoplasmatales archaeon ex4484_30]|nr:MAG: hypothetical protein B6U81_03525 [Thermoplasmatales archaeon ex4484_30]